ncbi:MAG: type II secretion system F family protein [Clostridiales bacterium]|nr:type II secretion system F family protein [Clostridiales bacterium]
MPLYQYEARGFNGDIVKGKMEALDEAAVITNLRQQNYYPISVKIYNQIDNLDLNKYFAIPVKEISIFCRQFAYSVASGISIMKALDIVKRQTSNKKLMGILDNVHDSVQKGKSLSAAMAEHKDLPDMLINMIKVGEVSGTLDSVLLRMADYYDSSYKQKQKVKSATTYPIVLSIFALIVVVVLITWVLPVFVENLDAGEGGIPAPTRILLSISDFLGTYGFVILLILVALILGIKLYIKKDDKAKENLDQLKLSFPLVGKMYLKIVTARFARTFGMLMSSGLPVISSLEVCANVVGNQVVKKHILEAKEQIKSGQPIADTLEQANIFPLMLTQMIRVGEETGTLESILDRTAEYYDEEVDTAIQQLTSMIEPLIIIVLAAVVGFIVLAMIMPMFEMFNTIA